VRNKSLYLGLIIIVGLLGYAGIGGLSIEIQSSSSASPMNMGLYGTSELVSLASRRGYKASVISSLQDLTSAKAERIVYVLIAPDKPLTDSEIQLVEKLYREGRISLLIADELGVVNPLTEDLLGVAVNGSQLRDENMVKLGLDNFVSGQCRIEGKTIPIVYSKPSVITGMPRGAEPLCMAGGKLWIDVDANDYRDDGEPLMSSAIMGVGLENRGSRAVVLADSSILVNYMIQGIGNIPPTEKAAEEILDWLAAGSKSTLFLFDNSHYKTTRYDAARMLRSLLLAPQIIVQSIMSIASAAGRAKYTLLATMLIIPLAALLMRPEGMLREEGRGGWRWSLAKRMAMEIKSIGSPCPERLPGRLVDNALKNPKAAERLASHLSTCLEKQRNSE